MRMCKPRNDILKSVRTNAYLLSRGIFVTMSTDDTGTAHAGADGHVRELGSGVVELYGPPAAARGSGEVARFLWRGEDMDVAGSVVRSGAGLVISRVEITARAAAGITHHLLRKVPLGSLLAEARAHAAASEPPALEAPSDSTDHTGSGYVAMTDDHLRRVAMAYLRETAPGKDRAAISRMEQEFGRPRGTILTWITRARKEGWLGPAVRGRLGSEAGPKLNAYAVEEGIDEIEPPYGAPTADDQIGVKRNLTPEQRRRRDRFNELARAELAQPTGKTIRELWDMTAAERNGE